ncbi:hypothetical protein NGRA_0021 [Nosema granulosis]|uniref:Uncharacterized protein n=1 Tax=Nosema granulosis TaxID=83296 RepID=A0A9P6H244_9MICR|nr:hypothetical protein NGRA_0021 [Nosema granulosis]
MIIKWHKSIVKLGNTKIKFKQDILTAETFKDWMVVATNSALYFMGRDEYVIPFSIYNIVFTENFIYLHSREDRNVYKLGHPLEVETFLFYSPYYILDSVIVHKNMCTHEDPIFILKANKTYVLKRQKSYFIHFLKIGQTIKYIVTECSFEEFINIRSPRCLSQPEEDLQINIDDSKEGIEFVNKVNSSLDDKITNLKVEDTLNVHTNRNYLIVTVNNLVSFIDFWDFAEDDFRLLKTKSYELEKDVDVFKPIKIRLRGNYEITVIQIDNFLFYKSNKIQIIDRKCWVKAFVKKKYSRNYHDVFWKRLTPIDRKIFACLEPKKIISLICDCISTNDYNFFKLEITKKHIEKINRILEKDLAECDSVEKFLEKNSSYAFFGKIPIIHQIQNLNKSKNYLTTTSNYNKLLEIKYERIFQVDKSLLVGMKFNKIRNLAYQIIFLEENKAQIFKEKSNVKKWERYRKLFYKNFNDARMDEVDLLFNEKPKQFDIENEAENINERAYVLRLSCCLGKSIAYFDSMYTEDVFEESPLVYPMFKNLGLVNIEIKEKNWKNWPSFNYSCCRFLSSSNISDISSCFIENRIKEFIKENDDSEHTLAGMFYAFGLRERFKDITFEEIKDLISDNTPLLSMVLIVSLGLSNKGIHNQDILDAFYHTIHTDAHPLIKIGYFIGMSYTFMNSGNVNLKNVLIKELIKKGSIQTEKHNKNNVLWYNKSYRLTMGFMLAYVLRTKKVDSYEFIKLENKLVELLVNGLVLFGSKSSRHIKNFKRSEGDPPEEIFYSEFFTYGCSPPENFENVFEEIKTGSLSIFEIYRYAGALFYIGVANIVGQLEDSGLYEKLLMSTMFLEERMLKDDKYRVLFDYSLIAMVLIRSSTCDLELLKIIRRQIKRTERSVWDRNKVDYVFTFSGMKKETQTTLTYGCIEKYKLCLGILTLGLSKYKLTGNFNTVIDLVATFYIDFPICTQDQDFFNLLRYNIFNTIGKNETPCFSLFYKFRSGKTSSFNEISFYFKKKFKTLAETDKKLTIDLLSDYYENHLKGEPLINMDYFKEQVIRCK